MLLACAKLETISVSSRNVSFGSGLDCGVVLCWEFEYELPVDKSEPALPKSSGVISPTSCSLSIFFGRPRRSFY